MKHTYRDAKTGRFASVPPPAPPPKEVPPRWADGRFVSREKWTEKAQHSTPFTGKSMETVFSFQSRTEAAEYMAATISGDLGEFIATAYTRIEVKPEGQKWIVKLSYRRPERGQVSP